MTVGEEILDLPAIELSERLAARTLTSVDLTEGYLARIARMQPLLNCFVTVTPERARADAARADAARAAGQQGPLLGLPYGVKDIIDTAGIRTTWGTRAHLDRVPERDADVVARLTAAGAVLLGKLSTTELANTFGSNWPADGLGGAHRNPWNRNLWAGGSAAGPGAAVAAGLCAFALGSETWGSIDCPSALNAVTGLRPTYDAVSRRGVMTVAWSLDKVGPMVRDARDAVMVLRALAQLPISLERATAAGGAALRVGYIDHVGFPSPDPAYDTAWAAAKDVLRASGVPMKPVTLPDTADEPAVFVTLVAESLVAFEGFIRDGHAARMFDRETWPEKIAWLDKLGMTASDYVKAQRVRAQVQRAYQAIFDEVDVLVGPGFPLLAPAVDAKLPSFEAKDTHFTLVTDGNAAGLPAVSLPMGFTASGLPLGMHVVAAGYRDEDALALAALVQAQTDHHRRRPPAA